MEKRMETATVFGSYRTYRIHLSFLANQRESVSGAEKRLTEMGADSPSNRSSRRRYYFDPLC